MQSLLDLSGGENGRVRTRLEAKKKNSAQQTASSSIQVACPACTDQEKALRKLWSQVQDRAHPTDFTWHCQVCGKETHIVVD
ncbi:MAG TPA: hypothetical protein VLV18_00360 [Terriglobales bacterium]|nr:hypothetical protein [Terriglobales bacterium]